MNHGSLFSGIGGFDLAAEWMGWNNVFHCEWNEFGQKILKHYWPNATSYGDITKTDFNVHRGQIDIITGGFPCQPYSQAGKRLGKEDDRHLWPEMLRAIREVQPRWIVGENVPGLLNWNGGMVLDEIKADLEGEGFEVFPPLVLPACGKNSPHQRDRLWIVAHSNGKQFNLSKKQRRQNQACYTDVSRNAQNGFIADTNGKRFQERIQSDEREYKKKNETQKGREPARIFTKGDWKQFPTESPVFNRNDGVSKRLDGITISNWRTESIKAAGNAIVPQVAYEIFKSIEQIENIKVA